MAGIPLLTLIRREMASLVGSMTIVGGYNYDWGAINNRNYAIGNFPRAEFYCSEENVDEKEGTSSQDYTNQADFEIRVAGKLTTSSTNPLFDINDVFDMATDDLKKVFGINNNVNDTCNVILYKGFKRTESSGSGDQFIPAKMTVRFKVFYSQDRITPTQYASS